MTEEYLPHPWHKAPKRSHTEATMRPLHVIAAEIRDDWGNPYFGAIPYLRAMAQLSSMSDNYGADSARSVVAYFLSNAATWRGETARRVKAELNAALKSR